MAKKTPAERKQKMKKDHKDIIDGMIDSLTNIDERFAKGEKTLHRGREIHELRIDGIPYWIMLAG